VVFYGTDPGEEIVRPGTPLEYKYTTNFARSIPTADAMNPANLLCYEVNGTALPAANGFQLSLIAPGWHGVANVKWLTRIEVINKRFLNRFMGRDYVTIREVQHDPAGHLQPAMDDPVIANKRRTGRATGKSRARSISPDGGEMRAICSIVVLYVGASAYAAPPPDASGVFADWFKSLTVPGIPGAPCCTVADCRMVEAIWNDQTRHYEARVMREKFSNALDKPIVSQEDEAAHQTAKSAWMKRWIAMYGDTPDVWIEIPEAKVNLVQNPTGHAVLCWSVSNGEFNGVYCFVPFTAAINDRSKPMNAVV
jgi:DMSO/TMAO reductase YedYZ molybdopterin-dependent catalytic subunit